MRVDVHRRVGNGVVEQAVHGFVVSGDVGGGNSGFGSAILGDEFAGEQNAGVDRGGLNRFVGFAYFANGLVLRVGGNGGLGTGCIARRGVLGIRESTATAATAAATTASTAIVTAGFAAGGRSLLDYSRFRSFGGGGTFDNGGSCSGLRWTITIPVPITISAATIAASVAVPTAFAAPAFGPAF